MARMIGLTPMYSEHVVGQGEDVHKWHPFDHTVFINVDAIVMINEVDDEDVGASVLIPDQSGHAQLFVAQSVLDVLDSVHNVQNWPTGGRDGN